MGADIHVNIFAKNQETKEYEELKLFKNNGEAIGAYAPYNNRNYSLFGVLAGVRGMSADFTDVRGYPEWFPQNLKDEYDDWTFSATWYDWVEINAYAKTPDAMVWIDDDEQYNVLQPWLKDIYFVLDCYGLWYPKPGDVIITMCFDN